MGTSSGVPRLLEDRLVDGVSPHDDFEVIQRDLLADQRRLRLTAWIIGALIVVALIVVLGQLPDGIDEDGELKGRAVPITMACAGLLTMWILSGITSKISAIEKTMHEVQIVASAIEAQKAMADLPPSADPSDLNSLLTLNRTQMATYHELSTQQARTAFRAAQVVMAASAVVILITCLLAVRAGGAGGVSAAAAGVIASAVGGYVATTFLEAYKVSVRQAEAYFREPMVAGYLMAAERIARSMSSSGNQDEQLATVADGFLEAAVLLASSPSGPPDHRAGEEDTVDVRRDASKRTSLSMVRTLR